MAASSHASNLPALELGLGGSATFNEGLPRAVKAPLLERPGFAFLGGT